MEALPRLAVHEELRIGGVDDPDVGSWDLRDLVVENGVGAIRGACIHVNALPGYQFMQDWIEYDPQTHHSNADTFERVVPEAVRRNAVIVASFVYLTANQAGRFPAPVPSSR